jgi:hypothetical protein
MASVRLSIDRDPAVDAVLNERRPDRWVAGPLRLYQVDLNLGAHYVVISDGERSGWEATASHRISQAHPQFLYLFGREQFHSPDGEAAQAATEINDG